MTDDRPRQSFLTHAIEDYPDADASLREKFIYLWTHGPVLFTGFVGFVLLVLVFKVVEVLRSLNSRMGATDE